MAAEASARRARREPNRLHRRTERLQNLLACVLGLLAVTAAAVAITAGGSAYASVAERARAEAADRTETTAVLLSDAVPVTRGGPANRAVPVRWTDRHGVDRTAAVPLRVVRDAGDRVPVWTADDGRLVPAPTSVLDATAAGVLVGALAAVVACGAVYLIGRGFYAWTDHRFRRAWELEWDRIGPEWTGGPAA